MKFNTVDIVVVSTLVLLTVVILIWMQKYANKKTGTLKTAKELNKVTRWLLIDQFVLLALCPFLIFLYLGFAFGMDSITYLSTHQPTNYKILIGAMIACIIIFVLIWNGWGSGLTSQVTNAFKKMSEDGLTDSYVDPLTHNLIPRKDLGDPITTNNSLDEALEQKKHPVKQASIGGASINQGRPHTNEPSVTSESPVTNGISIPMGDNLVADIPEVTSGRPAPLTVEEPKASDFNTGVVPEEPITPMEPEQPVAPVPPVQDVPVKQPVAPAADLGNTASMSLAAIMRANGSPVDPDVPQAPVEDTNVSRDVSSPIAPVDNGTSGSMSKFLKDLPDEPMDEPVEQVAVKPEVPQVPQAPVVETPVVPAPSMPRVEEPQAPVVNTKPKDDFDLSALFGLSAEEEAQQQAEKEAATAKGNDNFNLDKFFMDQPTDTVASNESSVRPDVEVKPEVKEDAKEKNNSGQGIDLEQFF